VPSSEVQALSEVKAARATNFRVVVDVKRSMAFTSSTEWKKRRNVRNDFAPALH